jgi:hypothetical protein
MKDQNLIFSVPSNLPKLKKVPNVSKPVLVPWVSSVPRFSHTDAGPHLFSLVTPCRSHGLQSDTSPAASHTDETGRCSPWKGMPRKGVNSSYSSIRKYRLLAKGCLCTMEIYFGFILLNVANVSLEYLRYTYMTIVW